jgi:hypothetical protein
MEVNLAVNPSFSPTVSSLLGSRCIRLNVLSTEKMASWVEDRHIGVLLGKQTIAAQ